MSKTPRIALFLIAATSCLHAQPRAKAWVSVSSNGTLDQSHSFNSSGAINSVSRLASDSLAASYTPFTLYTLNSTGGAITANRSATGTYNMTFTGLSASNSISIVTPFGGGTTSAVLSP